MSFPSLGGCRIVPEFPIPMRGKERLDNRIFYYDDAGSRSP